MDACWSFEYILVGRCSDVLFPASMALTQAVALLLRPQGLKRTTLQTSSWLRSIAVYWLHRAACQNSQGSMCVCLRVCMHVIEVSPLWFMTQCCPLLSPVLLQDTAHLPVSLPQSLLCTAAEHNSVSEQKQTGWSRVIRTHTLKCRSWRHGPVKRSKSWACFC